MPTSSDLVTYPLSMTQMEIWLAQQINPNCPAYNISQFTEIHGAVDPAQFEKALRQVVAETETLCLQFIESDHGVRQYVGSLDWSLPCLDLSADADPQAAAEVWMKADYEQPTDLLSGPLFSYALLKVTPNRFFWYQRYHHIALDSAASMLIVQRVAQVYSALAESTKFGECPFRPLDLFQAPVAKNSDEDSTLMTPLQGLERGLISVSLDNEIAYHASTQFTKDHAYWLKHCANWPELATLASRQAPVLHHHRHHTTQLASQTLHPYSSDASHLAHLMIASMAAYLHRLTGAQDVTLGFPVSVRDEAAHPLGSRTNILPLRFTVQPGMALSTLLAQAAQEVQSGLQHQRYPVTNLRPELGLPSSQALFSTILNIRPFAGDLSFGAYASSTHHLLNGPTEDLMLTVHMQGNGCPLHLDLNANPLLYTEEELSAHQRRFLNFLQTLLANPTQAIGEIDLLDAAERKQLLVDWNATTGDYPENSCIHQLFEEQVERTPEAIALVYENQSISYAELNAQANRLAHHLRELGVQPESRVALYALPSIETMVGILAVLKAGGAYVPLEPNYPPERLMHMVTDCAPIALLSIRVPHAAVVQCLGANVPILDLQADAAQWKHQSSHNLDADKLGLNPEHLAYVIYTSGSTGLPKGVMVQHQSLVNLVTAMATQFGMSPQDRMLQFASLCFDASVEETFITLTRGATLVLRTDAWLAGAKQFWQLCEANQISVIDLPTQFWAQLVQEKMPIPSSVRLVEIGGDALSAAARQAWFTSPGERPRLLNTYGPTEATVTSTVYEVTEHDNRWRAVGRPIANTRSYVLDPSMRPIPVGVTGELYLAGASITRGYLNRPELTAERFLPDPFSAQPNARMYKTGDLVRYLPDGNLEFLGRNDHQVKIRGFRVELGEIETRLTEHPQVREALVLAVGEGSSKRLVAYVVAIPDEQLVRSLREHVAANLPDYMVPAAFVPLPAFPMTFNGKLDRKALPAPDEKAFLRQDYEAPQGEIEHALAAIWTELLKVDPISRYDSFFDLGGHSLLAVQMASRIRTLLGLEITFRALFEAPTIARLAQCLLKQNQDDNTAKDDSFDVLLPIRPQGNRPPLFCIHPVMGLSWGYINLAKHLDEEQPIYGLQARGLNGAAPLAETMESMAADYIKQIRQVQPQGPYCLLGWSFGGKAAHCIATQLEQQGEKVALLALLDSYPKHAHDEWAEMREEAFYIKLLNHYGDKDKSGTGEYLWEKAQTVTKNNYHLEDSFSPLIYCGDMLFFRAAIKEDNAIPLASADLWRPYILGKLEVYDISCTHEDMDRPEPIAEIAPILARKLEALASKPCLASP